MKDTLRDLFLHNWSLKLVSFIFAVALWIYVSVGQAVLEVPEQVTLELKNIPANIVRVSDVPSFIDIKVSGSSAMLRGMEGGKLSYELDLSGAAPGVQSFKVLNVRIRGIPSGLKITETSPSEISIKFSERVEKTVPVEIVTKGEAAKGYIVEEKTATPALVKISGAREEMEHLSSISTEVIDISGLKEPLENVYPLDVASRRIDLADVREVIVRIKVSREMLQREFKNVPVTVENTDLAWSVTPKVLNLRLKGPADTLREMKPENIRLVIDAADLPEGRQMVKPQLVVPDEKEIVPLGLILPEVRLTLGKSKTPKKSD